MDMARPDHLDKDIRNRVERLAAQWHTPSDNASDSLSLSDLRLVLEHLAPLRALIRDIALDSPASASPGIELHAAKAARTESELEQALKRCSALEQDLGQCSDATQRLLRENETLKQASQMLERQLEQQRKALDNYRSELALHTRVPAELEILRNDLELARNLGLEALPTDNFDALTHTVAVLAQPDNLERLWNALKERCEAQHRSASHAENTLLVSALAWYNHNWRTRPSRLTTPSSGDSYDYEQHLRSRHSCTGEALDTVWLSGIADGSGRVLCKALVTTF